MPPYVRPRGEVVLALPEPVPPLVRVRSTFVLGSIEGVKASGDFDRYVARLSEKHRTELFAAIHGTWLQVGVAEAHYRACDALGLPGKEASRRGRVALERLGGMVYGTALQVAKQAGANPWTVLASFQRFWNRAYDGAGVAVYKVGPKEARIDLLKCSLCHIPYYRHALSGLVEGLVALFSSTVYLAELPQPAGPESATFRAQWV